MRVKSTTKVCQKSVLHCIMTTSNGVDINEIKNLIEIDGGKFIIVENSKPVMVVVSFEEYKKKIKNHTTTLQKTNPVPKELQSEELQLKDLPLT